MIKTPLADWRVAVGWLEKAPPLDRYGGTAMTAPVLIVPYVFEPALCQALVAAYEQGERESSGFMRDVDGKTTLLHDPAHKRRSDHVLADPKLIEACRTRIHRRLAPQVLKGLPVPGDADGAPHRRLLRGGGRRLSSAGIATTPRRAPRIGASP